MPFLWNLGGDRGCTLGPHSVLFLLIYYYSLFMFHVINWLAGRGVYFLRLSVEEYGVLLGEAIKRRLAFGGL